MAAGTAGALAMAPGAAHAAAHPAEDLGPLPDLGDPSAASSAGLTAQSTAGSLDWMRYLQVAPLPPDAPSGPVTSPGGKVTIITPDNGSTYAQGSTVLADYFCTPAQNPPIPVTETCVGTVADGAPVDTGSLGVKSFIVTYTALIGPTPVHTEHAIAHYTVAEVTEPGAPTLVGATGTDGGAQVSWQAPSSDGLSPVTAYNVYRDGSLVHTTADGTTFSFTDSGLTNGTQYDYEVAAVNAVGEGPKSSVVSAFPVGLPGPPINLAATSFDSAVQLTWDAPSSDGGSGVTAYRVYQDGIFLAEIPTSSATSLYVGTLTNGQEYDFQVSAVNVVGEGPTSTVVSATPMGVPYEPTNVAATGTDGGAQVTWEAPSDDRGSAVTAYKVYRDGNLVHTTPDASTLSFTDSGLTNGTEYDYEVAAVNAVGEGFKSYPVSATPQGVPGVPSDVSATGSDGGAQVSWQAPSSDGGSAVTAYKVYRDGNLVHTTPDASTLSFTDSGLTNGTEYDYEVAAVNAVGEGAKSSVVSATPVAPATAPGIPTSVTASGTDGGAQIGWAAPTSDGGSAVTAYKVYRDGNLVHTTPDGATLSFTDSGLTNGTEYDYEVAAVNAVGEGSKSSVVSATPVAPATAPGIPTSVTASGTDGGAQVSWSPPASNGGSTITAYRVYRDGVQVHETADGSTVSFTDSGLTNGTEYDYQVAAVNAVGEGPKSSVASATPVAAATAPGSPIDVAASGTNGGAQVSWQPPTSDGGSAVTAYRVFRDGVQVHETADGSTLSFTDSGLTNGTEYDYQVAAVNAVGEGPKSSVASATPVAPATAPGVPTSVTAAGTDGGAQIGWAAPTSDGGSAVTAYKVYRDGSLVHTTPDGTTLSFTDSGLTNGTEYDYEVAAVNAVGEGSKSSVVSVTPQGTGPTQTFTDVPPSSEFFEDVEWMAAEGIAAGYQPGPTYRPVDPVTRQAMSAFMYRLAESPTFTPPATPSFTDVPASHPFYDEIEWTADEGVATGFPDGTYKPSRAVTRQAMSAFMYRLAGSPGFTPPAAASFSDVPTGSTFFAEIEWMADEEITTGFPDDTYRPVENVTREAMSAFMHRLADGPGVDV